MKKIIFAFIAMASLSFQANAQIKREHKSDKSEMHHKKDGKHEKENFKDLNLTADQQAKLKAGREAAKVKMKAIKDDNSLTQEQKKAKMMDLRKEQKASMENLLTQEQKMKMKDAQKARMDKMRAKKNKKDEAKNELGLSTAQSAKMKEYNMASQQRIKAIQEDKSLTQEQKKAKMMAEQKARKDFMNNLLTPDQKKKMQEARKNYNGQRGQNGQNAPRGKREMNNDMDNR